MSDYLPKEEAAIREGEILRLHIAKGYIPINITKTGGLGGHLQNDGYTFEQCKGIAAKYSKRSEWKKHDYPTYHIASKLGWIDTIMPQNKPYGNKDIRYWTIERCCDVAKTCKTLLEFRNKYPSAYVIVCRNKWNDIVFADLKRLWAKRNLKNNNPLPDVAYNRKVTFDLEQIIATLKKYPSTSAFIKEHRSMYNWLSHHGIRLSEIATLEQLHNSQIGTGTKPIVQCDMEGNFVAEYNSARDPIGFDYKKISACCHGTRKSHKGYKWFFKQDFENNIK